MSRAFDQPIQTTLDEYEQPTSFYWNGRTHPVCSIEQCWEVDTDWWTEEGHTWRTYYAVTTTSGLLCVLAHDHVDGRWLVVRVYD